MVVELNNSTSIIVFLTNLPILTQNRSFFILISILTMPIKFHAASKISSHCMCMLTRCYFSYKIGICKVTTPNTTKSGEGMTLYKNWGHVAIYKGHTIASSHLITYVTNFRTPFQTCIQMKKKTTQNLVIYYGHMYNVTYPTHFYSGLVCSEK